MSGLPAPPGINIRIARQGVDNKDKLGRHRYVVERTISWTLNYKRPGLLYARTEIAMMALLSLACAFTCYKILNRPRQL
jgi:hypothetical protein